MKTAKEFIESAYGKRGFTKNFKPYEVFQIMEDYVLYVENAKKQEKQDLWDERFERFNQIMDSITDEEIAEMHKRFESEKTFLKKSKDKIVDKFNKLFQC